MTPPTHPSTAALPAVMLRIAMALALGISGYIHAELYLGGYRMIPVIGPAFLLQASGSFAVAVLLLAAGPLILRLGAAALALGALGGFLASRTVGVFGFIERGFDPAPQALISILAETAVLMLLGVLGLRQGHRHVCSSGESRTVGGH